MFYYFVVNPLIWCPQVRERCGLTRSTLGSPLMSHALNQNAHRAILLILFFFVHVFYLHTSCTRDGLCCVATQNTVKQRTNERTNFVAKYSSRGTYNTSACCLKTKTEILYTNQLNSSNRSANCVRVFQKMFSNDEQT